jgi:hypothetical protein
VNLPFSAIDNRFSHACAYFNEADVLVLLTLFTSTFLFFSSLIGLWIRVENNLSTLLNVLLLILCVMGLWQHLSRAGLNNPDNILTYVFGLTIVVGLTLLLLVDHVYVMDFDIQLSFRLLGLQATYALYNFTEFDVEIPYGFAAIFLSILFAGSLMPIYKYVIRNVSN